MRQDGTGTSTRRTTAPTLVLALVLVTGAITLPVTAWPGTGDGTTTGPATVFGDTPHGHTVFAPGEEDVTIDQDAYTRIHQDTGDTDQHAVSDLAQRLNIFAPGPGTVSLDQSARTGIDQSTNTSSTVNQTAESTILQDARIFAPGRDTVTVNQHAHSDIHQTTGTDADTTGAQTAHSTIHQSTDVFAPDTDTAVNQTTTTTTGQHTHGPDQAAHTDIRQDITADGAATAHHRTTEPPAAQGPR